MLTPDQCYQAVSERENRFDGMFFTAVHSTGIFCRPSCPARTPLRTNVDFYPTAAAATEAGFRACRRCRPDASPGSPEWDARSDITGRSVRLIRDGLIDRRGVEGLAASLGCSTRQLGRVLQTELGAGPLALARSERARTARVLVESTTMPMKEIAFAAGFSSIRQFNDTFRTIYAAPPSSLRRHARIPSNGELVMRLAYRAPLDLGRLFSYYADRAVPGIETSSPDHLTRSMRLAHGPAVVTLRAGTGSCVECAIRLADNRDLGSAVSRVRRMFDLDADPTAVSSTLASAGLGELVDAFPGIRSPGFCDSEELVIRTVLGQQISVAAARTHLTRLVAAHGPALPPELVVDGVDRVFPDSTVIADLPDEGWALPKRRIATLRAVAAALARNDIDLGPGCDRDEAAARMLALPGIGPWTIGYVRMRGLGDPDVFLAGDLGVKKGLAELSSASTAVRALERHAKACSPWRSYLTHLLWALHSRSERERSDTAKNSPAAARGHRSTRRALSSRGKARS